MKITKATDADNSDDAEYQFDETKIRCTHNHLPYSVALLQ